MRRHLAIAVLVVLPACAAPQLEQEGAIDFSRRPADWPELEIQVQTVTPATFAAMCAGAHRASGYNQVGCAVAYFCQRRCTVWISDVQLLEHQLQLVVGHERAHCRGYDHPGSSTMRDGWERAKQLGC